MDSYRNVKLDFSEIDSSEAAIRAALKTMLKR
jgi:hypothetical protein